MIKFLFHSTTCILQGVGVLARIVFLTQNRIHGGIFIGPPGEHFLPDRALTPHPKLLNNAAGSRVQGDVPGLNAVEIVDLKSVLEDSSRGLGAVALPPIRHPNPVADLSAMVLFGDMQTYRSNQEVVRFSGNGKGCRCPSLEGFRVPLDPTFCHAVFIGMGDIGRHLGDLPIPGEFLNPGCIFQAEGSET